LNRKSRGGEDFHNENKELRILIVKLQLAIRHYLASQQKGSNNIFSVEDEKILWGMEDNEYENKLNEVVKAFEEKIKPKLGRK
jgi:hypothetical protein